MAPGTFLKASFISRISFRSRLRASISFSMPLGRFDETVSAQIYGQKPNLARL
jgi:hypothetical protein